MSPSNRLKHFWELCLDVCDGHLTISWWPPPWGSAWDDVEQMWSRQIFTFIAGGSSPLIRILLEHWPLFVGCSLNTEFTEGSGLTALSLGAVQHLPTALTLQFREFLCCDASLSVRWNINETLSLTFKGKLDFTAYIKSLLLFNKTTSELLCFVVL